MEILRRIEATYVDLCVWPGLVCDISASEWDGPWLIVVKMPIHKFLESTQDLTCYVKHISLTELGVAARQESRFWTSAEFNQKGDMGILTTIIQGPSHSDQHP